MSMPIKASCQCPKCGKANDFTLWQTINTQRKNAAEDIISGELFEVICTQCGYITHVEYPILFNDMEHDTWIWRLESEDSIEEATKMLQKTRALRNRIRFVFSQNRLREKAIIFRAKLDDRIIEIMRIIIEDKVEDELEDDEINDSYFLIKDDKHCFEIFTEKGSTIYTEPLNELYDELESSFREQLEEYGDDEFVVDVSWVDQFMDFCDFDEN